MQDTATAARDFCEALRIRDSDEEEARHLLHDNDAHNATYNVLASTIAPQVGSVATFGKKRWQRNRRICISK
jgi:hypothetical protein